MYGQVCRADCAISIAHPTAALGGVTGSVGPTDATPGYELGTPLAGDYCAEWRVGRRADPATRTATNRYFLVRSQRIGRARPARSGRDVCAGGVGALASRRSRRDCVVRAAGYG